MNPQTQCQKYHTEYQKAKDAREGEREAAQHKERFADRFMEHNQELREEESTEGAI